MKISPKLIIVWAIIALKAAAQTIGFQCFSNVGHPPSLERLMNSVSMVTQSSRTSAMECAVLCLAQLCAFFAYNSATQQCFTKNVSVAHSGLFCGIALDQAPERCTVAGEAYIAYGGQRKTSMQCVCGTNFPGSASANWILYPNIRSYGCIDTCTEPVCQVKLGFRDPCGLVGYLLAIRNCIQLV